MLLLSNLRLPPPKKMGTLDPESLEDKNGDEGWLDRLLSAWLRSGEEEELGLSFSEEPGSELGWHSESDPKTKEENTSSSRTCVEPYAK